MIINLKNQWMKFFKWCMNTEGWERTGLFYEKYYVNGKALHHFQLDQTESVLIAISDYYGNKECTKFKELITKSAKGLCKVGEAEI